MRRKLSCIAASASEGAAGELRNSAADTRAKKSSSNPDSLTGSKMSQRSGPRDKSRQIRAAAIEQGLAPKTEGAPWVRVVPGGLPASGLSAGCINAPTAKDAALSLSAAAGIVPSRILALSA